MTIGSTTSRNDYTGNGAVDTYPYTFRITEQDQLLVTVKDTAGVETTLTLTTHYTVTGVGAESGGNVALVNGSFSWLDAEGDLKTGYDLTIRRVVGLVQETDIRNQGTFFPEVHEDAFDYLTFIDQQQQDEIDRSVKLPETESSSGFTLPTVENRANNVLGFDADGDPIAVGGTTDVNVSAFMETVLDDADAASARTTLGFTGAGGTVATAQIEDLAVTTAKLAANVLTADATGRGKMQDGFVTKTEMDGATTSSSLEISNLSIACSVGSSALTIAIKDKSGSDPSATSPVTVGFRNATSATGTYLTRQITSALSMTVSSGSTLGHVSGQDQYVFVYLLDNAGTPELAVCSHPYDDGSIRSTTAEGGAGGADSASVMYSTTARSNVPVKLIGRLKSNQVTAGTWALVPAEITLMPFDLTVDTPSTVFVDTGNGHGSTNTKIRIFTQVRANTGNAITRATTAAAGDSFTINRPGLYAIHYVDSYSASTTVLSVSVNAASLTTSASATTYANGRRMFCTGPSGISPHLACTLRLAAGDVVRAHDDGNNDRNDDQAQFSITYIGR